ncbi:hypothetical protein WHE01_17430 [Weissella hellenica]|nr:hypothetical protein WHE01_17430 [Weissella hellenica]
MSNILTLEAGTDMTISVPASLILSRIIHQDKQKPAETAS